MISKEELVELINSLRDLSDYLCNGDISLMEFEYTYYKMKPQIQEKIRRVYTGKSYDNTLELQKTQTNNLGIQHDNDSDESYCVDHKYNSWENSNLREDAIYFANKYCDKNAETREVLLTANKILGYMQDIKNQDDVELRRRAISLAESKNGDISKLLTIADMYYQYLKNGKIPEANYKR